MSKHHKRITPARVRSATEQRRDTHAMAAQTAAAARQSQANLALLRMALMEMAGTDPAFVEAQTQAIDETRAALATLERCAPTTLAFAPDLLESARSIVAMAEARTHALDSLPLSARRQLATLTPDTVKVSPTQSTPVASGEAGNAAWAGMGVKRNDAQGVPNAQYLRRLATKDPWIQAAITYRKQQIGRADIACVPLDETRKYDTVTQKALERLLNYPNELRDSYRSLIEPVIDDILVLDRGCVSKDLDARGIPHHLYYEDGATIRIYADWNGDPKRPHYVYQPPNSQDQIPLYNEQCIVIMANAASYRFGLSPVQVLLDTIQADLAATEKAMHLVRDVPPPHLIHMKGATDKNLKSVRSQYEMDVMGQRELMFLGWGDDVKVFPMMFSLKDNQFLEWQVYLVRKICAILHISPQALGITFDINRATAETQADMTDDSGVIPLLLLLEEYWNRELVADYAKVDRDGRPLIEQLNLGILFPEVSEIARILHADRVLKMAAQGMAGLPILTPNAALRMLGEQDIPGGNTLWVMTTQGPMPFLSYDQDLGFYGEYATAGSLGSQPPAGGVDAASAAPQDTTHQKPDRSAPNEAALGNESSGNGEPPDSGMQQSGDTTNGNGNAEAASKAIRPLYVPQYDHRKPGKAWRPSRSPAPLPILKAASGKRQPQAVEAARKRLEAQAHQIFSEVG